MLSQLLGVLYLQVRCSVASNWLLYSGKKGVMEWTIQRKKTALPSTVVYHEWFLLWRTGDNSRVASPCHRRLPILSILFSSLKEVVPCHSFCFLQQQQCFRLALVTGLLSLIFPQLHCFLSPFCTPCWLREFSYQRQVAGFGDQLALFSSIDLWQAVCFRPRVTA